LELFIGWGVKHRGWIPKQARTVFSASLIVFSLLLAGFTVRSRVIGPDIKHPAWGESNSRYAEIENGLRLAGATKDEIVLVNNAPGYFVATGRSAISIPDGGLTTTLLVAKKFNGAFLILEFNHPPALDELYRAPTDQPGIKYLTMIGGAQIFRIVE
jgi:hypothetical protein